MVSFVLLRKIKYVATKYVSILMTFLSIEENKSTLTSRHKHDFKTTVFLAVLFEQINV